jgi:uncharacterized protein YcfL
MRHLSLPLLTTLALAGCGSDDDVAGRPATQELMES